jgi:thioredoxin
MSQVNTLFNALAIAAIAAGICFWTVKPFTPKQAPNDAQWASRINRPGVVLAKFGAEWCPPCRMIEKELDQLESSSGGRVSVVKVNVDEQRDLAAHYGVRGIPHLLLFKDGKQVAEATGFRNREQLEAWIAAKAK